VGRAIEKINGIIPIVNRIIPKNTNIHSDKGIKHCGKMIDGKSLRLLTDLFYYK
jgi:hypothetical protein